MRIGKRLGNHFDCLEAGFSLKMALVIQGGIVFKRICVFALLVGAPAVLVWAESVNAPIIKAGDTWIYKTTTEKGASGWNQTRDETKVSRVTSSTIYYTVKPDGSTQPAKELFAGLDWSRARDIDGKETVVNRPLAFPLTMGKAWEVRYTEQHPNK
jgi:hypothetical protein